MRKLSLLISFVVISIGCLSQRLVFKDAISHNRTRLFNHLIQNTINKNLLTLLTEENEDRWEDAFYALELINERNEFINERIDYAVSQMDVRSTAFQRSLLELLFANYKFKYNEQLSRLLKTTRHPKIFAMAAEYLLEDTISASQLRGLLLLAKEKLTTDMPGPWLEQLIYKINNRGKNIPVPSVHSFLEKSYLPGNVLMISFQRKNRDYPGLVIVRNADGEFIQDSSGFFHVPQLARSISNLPGYITNGNTPEGIFRMDGFDVSKGSMIGPSINVQLTMPFEYNAKHFYRDSSLTDSAGNVELYKNLLPQQFHNYYPIYQAYYAGKAGRSEIIAHGTTIDPDWYYGLPYYPLTPTVGCLATKEIWSRVDGSRLESDQQLLTDAIARAGGANGYAIVININDKESPVYLDDIMPFLKLAGQIK